jgi:hypothetical protein
VHAETDNLAVDLVRLKGGYHLQYIFASVRNAAESEMPMTCKGKGSEIKVMNMLALINIVFRSNNNF